MICRSEWDLQAGPMCRPMSIPTLASTIRYGRGGVAGVAAGVVGAAGAGLHLTGTRGGRIAN